MSSRFYQCCGIEFPEGLGKYGCPNFNGDKVARLIGDHHMPTARTHYFRDDNDDRTVVNTVLLKTGQYKAYVIEGLHNDLDVRGYGHSRLAAIADLNAAIEKELAQ